MYTVGQQAAWLFITRKTTNPLGSEWMMSSCGSYSSEIQTYARRRSRPIEQPTCKCDRKENGQSNAQNQDVAYSALQRVKSTLVRRLRKHKQNEIAFWRTVWDSHTNILTESRIEKIEFCTVLRQQLVGEITFISLVSFRLKHEYRTFLCDGFSPSKWHKTSTQAIANSENN